MLDLDEVISKVERMELSAHTRERHLVRLHALQAVPTGRRSIGSDARKSFSPRPSRAILAGGLAAAAVAVVAGASALLVPAHHAPILPATPGVGSITVTSSAYKPTEPVKTTGSNDLGLTDAAFSKQLAVILGISDEKANAVTAQLNNLGGHGGVGPTSSQFAQIAAGAGVKPAQLAAAIDRIKMAQFATGGSTGAVQSKGADIKDSGTQSEATTGASGAQAKSTAQNSAQNLLTTDRGVGLLASTLNLSHQKATELAAKLSALQHGGGLDPQSTGFQSIAHDFGLTSEQLARAINQIKKAGS